MTNLKNHSGFWLRDDACQAFNRLEDRHGLFTVNSAGRTEAQQQGLINRWDKGGAANRPPYLYAPARPASASNHVANGGIAVDIGNWESFLQVAHEEGFTHPFPTDVVHFEFHGAPPAPPAAPAGSPVVAANPFGISDVRGLQKIAHLNGGDTQPDNAWGPQSALGFSNFLRATYGYVGNNVLGPQMWAAIARWLRARWGYVGNDVPGPVMRAALATADARNFAEL